MVLDVFEHCDKDPSSFKNMLEDAKKHLYGFKAFKAINFNEIIQYKRTLWLV